MLKNKCIVVSKIDSLIVDVADADADADVIITGVDLMCTRSASVLITFPFLIFTVRVWF